MGSMQIGGGMPQDWQELCCTRHWPALQSALGEHMLRELAQILNTVEDYPRRERIVEEVLRAAPGYGDRAVIVALARLTASDRDGAP
jgi:hypothetical protein